MSTATVHEPVIGDCNIALHLPLMARQVPDQDAIVWRTTSGAYSSWTFRELDDETDRYAHGLADAGITRGMSTILMVRPSPEFFALTFALYKIGAVPVLIDPGMGKRRMVACLEKIRAEAFIGIPIAHVLRLLHRNAFGSVRIVVTVGRRWGWGGHTLASLRSPRTGPFPVARTTADDPAAIIFTTGSTGPPKAVLYRHGMFDAQVRLLRDHFGITPGEIDLPTFPLFALFDPALGMTAVIPEMDPTRPALVDPVKIIRAIQERRVTHMFGSPALLNRVGAYGKAHGIRLPTIRRVISAGAAVPPTVLECFASMLEPAAKIHTPYGATEALPVASIDHGEILNETRHETERGAGTCVGRPLPDVTVRVIRISDETIARWSDDLVLPNGQIGEIVVKGPMATREYLCDEHATRLAKIRDVDDCWHRMGDVGRIDERGRVWFCGRKSHRIQTQTGTLFTEPCEAIFNRHPSVWRSALVGVGPAGKAKPVVCIELNHGMSASSFDSIAAELRDLAGANPITESITDFLCHPAFPVDIRHNSKIFREKLAVWAARRLGDRKSP